MSELVSALTKQLNRDEGRRRSAYKDSKGYLTIGVGRLIDAKKNGGLSDDEMDYLLRNDIERVEKEVLKKLPWASNLNPARLGVLLNMAFQMGPRGLLGFKNTLAMIKSGDYEGAAAGMLNSKWARYDSPNRAKRLSTQMKTGEWQ